MWKLTCITCLMALIAVVLAADCPKLDEEKTDSKTKLFKGQQIFTVNFLREMLKEYPDKNLFFSPYSVYRALLLAYMGSKNATENALYEALNLHWSQEKSEVMSAYKSEKAKRQAFSDTEKSMQFEAADKFFFSNDVEIDECVAQTFKDEVEKLDFKDSAAAAKHINDWVEKITQDQIKDLLTADAIDAGSKLVVANAAYFKGLWKTKFDEEDTSKEIFYVRPDKNAFVDMMKQVGRFSVSANEELGCHVLEMPYNQTSEEKGVSFVVFIPPFPANLDEVLAKITPDTLAQALSEVHMQQVDLKFPRITLEQETKIVPILSQMGLGNIFSEDSDFSGFAENTKIKFNDAVHKAKIEIDEAGSRAAAATALFMFRSSRPLEPVQIHCNHPFLFMIYDHKTRAILFAGIYRGPEE